MDVKEEGAVNVPAAHLAEVGLVPAGSELFGIVKIQINISELHQSKWLGKHDAFFRTF